MAEKKRQVVYEWCYWCQECQYGYRHPVQPKTTPIHHGKPMKFIGRRPKVA